VLTPRGIAATLLAVALTVSGWVLSLPELAAAGLAIGALVVMGLVWIWVPGKKLQLRTSVFPNPAHAGTTSTVTTLVSGRMFRAGVIRASMSDGRSIRLWTRSGRRRRQTGTFPLPLPVRGKVTIGPYKLHTIDPMGLASRRLATAPPFEVLVLPRVYPAAPLPSVQSTEPDRVRVTSGVPRRRTGPTEPAGLRGYVAGDELRLVHWPASARGRGLLVRTFDDELPSQPTVLLDDCRSCHTEASFELAVEVAASLLAAPRQSDVLPPALLLVSQMREWPDVVGLIDPEAQRRLALIEPVEVRDAVDLPHTTVFVTGPSCTHLHALDTETRVLTVSPASDDRTEIQVGADLARWTEVCR
jgi:uncharacterized protein (DUF58 family)